MKNNPLNEVVTASEAALIIGTTVRNVRALCKRGSLEARLASQGTWIILRSAVEAHKGRNQERN